MGMKDGLFNPFFTGNYANPYNYYSGGASYSEEFQAILDVGFGTAPSASYKSKGDAFIQDLKDAGLWDKTLSWKWFTTDGDSDFALIDWVNPSDETKRAEKVNNPTHSANGFVSNGTSSYLLSGLDLADVTQNSVTYAAAGIVDSGLGNRTLFGAGDGGNLNSNSLFLNPRNGSNVLSYNISDAGSGTTPANLDATARILIARDQNVRYYSLNGAAFTSEGKAAAAITTPKEIALLAFTGSSILFYNTGGIRYFGAFNGKLSNTEAADLDTAITNYLS